jgi:hypothetical protein
MDANSGAAISPGRNFWFGRWFWAVFVGGVESQGNSVLFFRHSFRVSKSPLQLIVGLAFTAGVINCAHSPGPPESPAARESRPPHAAISATA